MTSGDSARGGGFPVASCLPARRAAHSGVRFIRES